MTLYRIMDLVKNGIAISYLFFLVLSRISQNKLKRKITPVCLFLTEAASAIRFVKYIVINNILRYITAGSCNIIVAPSLTDIYFKELINSVTNVIFYIKISISDISYILKK